MSPPTAPAIADDEYVDVVLGIMRSSLRALARRQGDSLNEVLGDPEQFARRAMSMVPIPSRFADTVGPVFRPVSLARAMGSSRQWVSTLVKRRQLLALTTADGHLVIPAYCLTDSMRPLPGLDAVLQVLTDDVVDEWTLAAWLTAPHPRLDGRSVIDHLVAGGPLQAAVGVAEAARRRWAR